MNLINDLRAVNGYFEDSQLKAKLLMGLTPQWNRLVENIHYEQGLGRILTAAETCIRLLTFESLITQRKATAGTVQTAGDGQKKKRDGKRNEKSSNGRKQSGGSGKRNPPCPSCKKPHPGGEAECWFLHPEKNPFRKDKDKD